MKPRSSKFYLATLASVTPASPVTARDKKTVRRNTLALFAATVAIIGFSYFVIPATAWRMLVPQAQAATFTVTNTSDTGPGSLRGAIASAKSSPGTDTVTFNIPANDPRHFYYTNDGVAGTVTRSTIAVTAASDDTTIGDIDPDWPHSWYSIETAGFVSGPLFSNTVTIDGLSQPGSVPNTNSGGSLNSVLKIEVTNNTTDFSCSRIFHAAFEPVVFRGMVINGCRQSTESKLIDFDFLSSSSIVTGNYLGTDPSGTIGLGSGHGVHVTQAFGVRVGGSLAADRNLISANVRAVVINSGSSSGASVSGGSVIGNLIGTARDGVSPLGNGFVVENPGIREDAINIQSNAGTASNNRVENNVIAFSAGSAVSLEGGGVGTGQSVFRNPITNNSIHSNGSIGISLPSLSEIGGGVTPNDPCDADTGMNEQQNFPVIKSAIISGNTVSISGTLNSTPGGIYRLEFFASPVHDPTYFGEGQTVLGSSTLTIPLGSCIRTFNVSFPLLAGAGNVITATATDAVGNTSEFSAVYMAQLQNDSCTLPPDGLVSWYSAQGNVNDSQNENHGKYIQFPPRYIAGKVGQAFDLGQNITNVDLIEVPDDPGLDLTNAFTIEMWVAPAEAGLATGQTFFISKGDFDSAGTQSYGIMFTPDRKIVNRVGNGTAIAQLVSSSSIALTEFTHIAATYDGTTLRVYVNGVLDASQATSIGSLLNTSGPLVIGGAYFGNSRTSAKGATDEPSLYNRALSDAEIASIFGAGTAGKCTVTSNGPGTRTWDGGGATNNWSEGANWSGDVAPSSGDAVVFDGTSTKNAVVDTVFSISSLQIFADYSGTISQGSSNLTIGSGYEQLAGTFVSGNGVLSIGSTFTLNGGSFTAPTGTLNLVSTVTISAAATFNANGGTLAFTGIGAQQNLFLPASVTANNVVVNKPENTSLFFFNSPTTLITTGTLSLVNGKVDRNSTGTLEARGDVSIAQTFDGGTPGNPAFMLISGAATRTIAFPAGSGAMMLPLTVNAPNVTLNSSGAGTYSFNTLDLQSCSSFSNNSSAFVFEGNVTTGNGCGLTQGSGSFSFNGSYTQNGGTFSSGSGALDFRSTFDFNGGTFIAPAGSMSFFQHVLIAPGAIFNPNGGTVVFTGISAQQFLRIPTTFTLNNVAVNRANNTELFFFNSPTTLVVAGTLSLIDGRLERNSTGTVEARGNISVAATFDGGVGAGFNPAFFLISGGANQTYTNNGGVNPGATWTINKSAGTLTAATSLILQESQSLNITNGTLYLNENSNLTAGAVSIGTGGRLVNESSTTITLGGNLSNSGTIDLNGGGASCPGTDSILIRSSSATLRTWSGGRNRLIDVDVQNMGGTGTKTVYSGTNSGGNNATWVFDNGCPPDLTITPSVAGVTAGELQIFTAGGGFAPYTFSLPVNNSGATIEAATGRYTAGSTLGASDTVRVTDAFGTTADAAVTVVGAPTRLGFIVQPSNTTPGQAITPSVKVAAQDANGNTVTTINPTITISIANNPSGGTLSGTLTRDASFGVATFDNLSIDDLGNGYTLQATNIGLATGTSNGFNIGSGAPARLGFTVQPTNTSTGEMITPPVQVAIQDAFGNLVTTATDPVTIAIANNPSGGLLSGTLTRSANGGIAIFDDLTINSLGNGYTLSANSGSLIPGTSAGFNIDPPFVVTNTNDSGPGSLRQIITDANNAPGRQTVRFNIPGSGPFSIVPITRLPNITQALIIDGSTQPGFSGTPIIELRGSDTSLVGLYIADRNAGSPGSIIKSLIVNGWGLGIFLDGNGTTGGNNRIQGCYIGTDASGSIAVPNNTGIYITSTSLDLIGGLTAGEGNVISGNNSSGVTLINAREVVIQGNRIGTQADGASPLPNVSDGITIAGNSVENNKVGGVETGAGNVIAFNGRSGVRFANGIGTGILFGVRMVGNQIVGNSIFSNGKLGISLQVSFASPLQNDPTDVDDGANRQQNFPNLLSASPLNGTTRIEGSLNSRPSSSYRLEFFSNPTCDLSGHGEGKTLIGTMNVTTDAGGIADITSLAPLPVLVPNGLFITATATDAEGNTSEFSNCTVVSNRYRISGTVTKAGVPLSNAQVWLTNTQSLPLFKTTLTNSLGNYSFELIQQADHTLFVDDPNLTFTPPSRFYPSLSQDQTNQNFASGTPQRFTLRGRARTNAAGSTVARAESEANILPPVPAGGFPLLGVTFNVAGPGVNRNLTNDRFGNFRFDALPPGNYVVTPTKPNYVFNPPLAGITIDGNDQSVDFDGTSLALSTLSGRIVYDSQSAIKAMNADGSGLVTLPTNSRTVASLLPRLSENGRRIVFVSRSTTGTQNRILAISADGTGSEFLTTANAPLSSPVFSPDGTRVAFHNSGNGLIIMNADGSNVQSVVSNCADPDWSPDGTQIVCLEDNGGTTRVKTVNLNTTAQTSVDNTSGQKFSPRWSPDGTKIAFIRRQSGTPSSHSIVVRSLLGGTDSFMSGTNNLFQSLSWSPDGARLLFVRDSIAGANGLRPPGGNKQLVTIQASDGQNMLVIVDGFDGTRIDWGTSNSFPTPASPTQTTITSGAVSISFPSTTGANAFTTITPIEPNSAGTAPNGFVIGNFAFEISTTAGYTPPVTICVDLDTPGVQSRQLRPPGGPALMHNENGVLVNITTSYDATTGILCGQANSFSPFVVAEQIDTALASISGLVVDADGAPMSGVRLDLTGAESDITQTDSNGQFTFVNLINGANYNVQPQSVGYIFTEYSQDLLAVAGENTVVFTGTESLLQIAGRVANPLDVGVAGVSVTLDGAANDEVVTDAGGNYLFTGLPADGSYWVTPSSSGLSFSPGEASIGALTSSVSGVDFTAFAPTAASVSVSGQALTADGRAIRKAVISLSDAQGNIRTALTNPFGYYRFEQVEVGSTYFMTVAAKGYQFENPSRTVTVIDELTDINFTAEPEN